MINTIFSPGHKDTHLQYAGILPACLLLSMFLFSACMTGKHVSVSKAPCIQQLEEKNSKLSSKLTEQKLLSKKLQTKLLMQHKEFDACRQANEKLIKELLQIKAKLATRGSKLEAATLVAEATAVISTIEKKSLNDAQKTVRKKATQNLEYSRHELAKGNYEIAAFLSRKAIEKAKNLDIDKEPPGTPGVIEKEIFFSYPLKMELFIAGNLRSAPSIVAEVKKVLPEGNKVTAIGFKQDWVKVKLADSEETGWIHLSLLY